MKKLLLILLCLPMIGFGQPINIPDSIFKAYLVGNTAINLNLDTEIQVSEATAFGGAILCSGLNIYDLTGIEYFTSLTQLDVGYWNGSINGTQTTLTNQLTTLDVSNNTALTVLNCSANQLTSLDVSNNTDLWFLQCNGNQLTNLDVSANISLTTLYCQTNQLTNLDVSNNTALTHLRCWSNNFTSLDISTNTALEWLDCSFNNLTSLDVSGATALTYLRCCYSQLTSLDVSANTALTELQCYNNQLTSLDVSNNDSLIELWCSNNQITSLDVSNNTALEILSTGDEWGSSFGNPITFLDLTNNTSLIELYVGYNNITNLDLSQNIALTHLKCDSNQLTSLDLNANTALEILTCSYTSLTSLDLSANIALKSLLCWGNQLTSLDVSNNDSLTQLWCFNNQLTTLTLDVSNNTALTVLRCGSNQLTSLDVSNNTALTYLSCRHNQLTSLDVSNNTALTYLSCRYNQLTTLDVSNNTSLEVLSVNYNQITSLDLRNGNNTNFTDIWASPQYPNLYCIDVDDVAYADTNWTAANGYIYIDSAVSFSTNCATALGCTDSLACNYDVSATIDDNSCGYATSASSSDTACNSYTWEGQTITTSQVLTHTYLGGNAVGCDSTHTLSVTINNSNTASSSDTACNSYTWEGQTITTSQVLTHTYVGGNAVGCDSTHTLSVTINNSNTASSSVTACDSYTWEGQAITTSQVLTHIYLGGNAVGCDSTHTLSVTINNSPITSTILGNTQTAPLTQETYVVSQSIGSVYNWQLSGGNIINGQNTNVINVLWGNTSGTYTLYVIETDINGCIGDTVSLSVTIGTTSNIENQISSIDKKLIRITDMLGQETPYRKNTSLFYIYDDGTVEKRITVE